MDIKKSQWVADGDRVHLNMPIAKVDKENRLVSGFATLDNSDKTDDVVTAAASKVAFSKFKGNIREMHQPIAAGRLVDFKEEEFYHEGNVYKGIFATAYVSKGAQDTWEKVLDGTLSGFSIGGNIKDQETKFVKDAEGAGGKNMRFIKEYDLIELSLVDNPANQLANIFSIQKNSEGESFLKGMVAETQVVNIFWCPNDEIAKNSEGETETCLHCNQSMKQIGWFERGEDAAVKTASTVASFLKGEAPEATTGEGGVNMTDETKDAEVANEEVATDVVTSDEVTGAGEETATETNTETSTEGEGEKVEEIASEPDFEKMFGDLKNSIDESLQKSKDSVDEAVEKVQSHVADINKSFEDKTAELQKSLGELTEKFEQNKTEREGLAKRLDALESQTAIRKSGEVENEPVEKAQKGSFWGSTFFEG